MTVRKETPFSGVERARAGLIVTAVEIDSGRTVSFQRRGLVGAKDEVMVGVLDVVRQVAAELDTWPGEWRVRTMSSPTSILGDMREHHGIGHAPHEAQLLGRVQRLDLLEVPPMSKKGLRAWEAQRNAKRDP